MCGIIGAFNPKGIKKIDLNPELDMMEHRGPDSKGTFYDNNVCLGHRRLSIIDLSNAADQPMKDDSGLVIVFNGEIYNYKEVKEILLKKGYKFKTSSDTEVILKSYLEWGKRCTDYLEGMWAFCIYDPKNKSVFLSRDRIGEKPLIYHYDKKRGTLYFASEIPPLVKMANLKPKVDLESLHLYFVNPIRHMPAERTIFQDIKKLEPANNMYLDKNREKVWRYWDISFKKNISKNWIQKYKQLLKEAVHSREVSDVPIGLLLSGGLDSSSIALYLKNKDIISYSIGMDKNDPELKRAERVAKILEIKNKQIIFSKDDIVKRALDINKELICNLGEPINLIQTVYTKMIMEEVKKDNIKVIIAGNAADEIFYGYDSTAKLRSLSLLLNIFDKMPLNNLIKKTIMKIGRLTNGIPGLALRMLASDNNKRKAELYRYNGKKAKALYNKKMKDAIKGFDEGKLIEKYARYCNAKNFIEKSYYTGLTVEDEHSITMLADIGAMAESIELRTPFLHKGLMKLSGELPIRLKAGSFFMNSKNKYIMRKALAKTKIEEITKYKKMGFGYGVDMGKCFRTAWRKETERLLFDVLPKLDLFNMKHIKSEFNKVMNKKGQPYFLWGLISVAMWYEQFYGRMR